MNLEQALEKLFSLHQFGIKLGLENIQKLLNKLGNPERSIKTIHVAGSNGKGSTASFISSVFMEAKYNTGLYTSPHLIKFNERIRINGEIIPDDFVLKFMNDLNDYIDVHSPTFFELTTAMAFQYFADKKVDIAIIETGLGGRLDATNVLSPLASVITTISEEHTNILGDDLKVIAAEKGGIIKRDSNVILGSIKNEPQKVLIDLAIKRNSQYFLLEKYADYQNDAVLIDIGNEKINISNLPLFGKYQLDNAALAVLTVSVIKPNINNDTILNGLKNVIPNSGIQARYEVYHDKPIVIFDAAHNLDGVKEFLSEFRKRTKDNYRKTVIYGTMKEKNYSSILSELNDNFDEILVTDINHERAASIDEIIYEANISKVKVSALYEPAKYVNEFISGNKPEILVVLGSIYVLGEIKKKLLNN